MTDTKTTLLRVCTKRCESASERISKIGLHLQKRYDHKLCECFVFFWGGAQCRLATAAMRPGK